MSDHVTAVCRTAYYQPRQLRTIARSLLDDAKKTLVQSFVSCRLDYCNALLYGISGGLVQRLQSVQNATARLVTGARRRDLITPVLRQLHWLPVRQRIDFKLAVLVYKSLYPASLRRVCRTTVNSSRRWDVDISGHRTSTRVQCRGHSHRSVTDGVVEQSAGRTSRVESVSNISSDICLSLWLIGTVRAEPETVISRSWVQSPDPAK